MRWLCYIIGGVTSSSFCMISNSLFGTFKEKQYGIIRNSKQTLIGIVFNNIR